MEKEKFVDLKLNEKKPPIVLEKIGMRDGEVDVRKLSNRDFRQLEFRLLTDQWQFQKATHDTLVTVVLILLEIAKKLGIDNIYDLVDEKVGEAEAKEG